jgi:N-acyl-D-aspartate/D-glutamate deacylase
MKPEWIKTGIASPGVMIASDGMPYAKLAHPRTAGTFSRVLGKYVREEKSSWSFRSHRKNDIAASKKIRRHCSHDAVQG